MIVIGGAVAALAPPPAGVPLGALISALVLCAAAMLLSARAMSLLIRRPLIGRLAVPAGPATARDRPLIRPTAERALVA